MNQAFVYGAAGTPFGKFGSGLAAVRPDDLAAHVIKESVKRAPALDPSGLMRCCSGNANGAGEENRNIARMGTLLAACPYPSPAPRSTGSASSQTELWDALDSTLRKEHGLPMSRFEPMAVVDRLGRMLLERARRLLRPSWICG
jgi:acetyl-CoA acetyltransferase